MKRPIEPAAEIRLGDLGDQFNKLGLGEMPLETYKQLVAYIHRRTRHTDRKIQHEFFDLTEHTAFPVMRETL